MGVAFSHLESFPLHFLLCCSKETQCLRLLWGLLPPLSSLHVLGSIQIELDGPPPQGTISAALWKTFPISKAGWKNANQRMQIIAAFSRSIPPNIAKLLWILLKWINWVGLQIEIFTLQASKEAWVLVSQKTARNLEPRQKNQHGLSKHGCLEASSSRMRHSQKLAHKGFTKVDSYVMPC